MSERDELTEKVRAYLDDFQDTTGYDNHDMGRLSEKYTTDIIALVRADERRVIREALLSPSVMEVMDQVRYEGTVWNYEETMIVEGEEAPNEEVMAAALSAIGLTESEASRD